MTIWKLCGLSIAIIFVLVLGYLLHNFSFSVMAEFGLLIYFYYSYQPNGKGLWCMSINGLLAFLGFGILLFVPDSILVKSLILAVLAMLTMQITKRYYQQSIGPFFVIMIASLGGTIQSPSSMLFNQWFYLAIGIIISIIVAFLIQKIGDKKFRSRIQLQPPIATMTTQQINLLSHGYGITLFIAYLFNLLFPYHHYNWLTVSAAANLKENAIEPAIKRYGWYLLGNVIGAILIWGISLITTSTLTLLILTALFFIIIAIVININYGLALAFATPLAVFLFDILHGTIDNDLIVIRLISILIGSFIGITGDIVLNKILNKLD